MKVSVNGGCTISETEREEKKEGPVWEDLLCVVAIKLFVSVIERVFVYRAFALPLFLV